MNKPLSIQEARDLTRHELVVIKGPLKGVALLLAKIPERDFDACRPSIVALVAIHDGKLFRNSNRTFEGYLKELVSLEIRWFRKLVVWVEVNEANENGPTGPIGPKLNECQARKIMEEAKRDPSPTPLGLKLQDILGRRIEEVAAAKQQAARDRPTLDRPRKDRLEAIKGKLNQALRLIDGSIDCADELEEAIRAALQVAEEGSAVRLAA